MFSTAPDVLRTHRTATRILAASLALALGGALFTVSEAHADVVDAPSGSGTQILLGSRDPSLAITSGTWAQNAKLYQASGATVGCPAAATQVQFAITVASDDGSTEEPAVTSSTTPFEVYDLVEGSGGVGVGGITSGLGKSGLLSPTGSSYTSSPSQESGVRIDTLTPGTTYSYVEYCADYVAETSTKVLVPDETGHAVAAWFHFTAGDVVDGVFTPTDAHADGLSEGFQVSASAGVAKPTPSVAITATGDATTTTLTATVTDDSIAITDGTGTVEFYEGEDVDPAHLLGSTGITSSGTAVLALTGSTALATGAHTLTARYVAGTADAYNGSSLSDPFDYSVPAPAASTATTLAVSGALVAGQTQTLTATVAPAAAGTVSFADGETSLGSATVASGVATRSVQLGAGAHSIVATFTPTDPAAYAGSVSTPSDLTITEAQTVSTKTSLSVLGNRVVGRTLALTATVSPSAAGTVAFKDGSKLLKTVTVSGGKASYTAKLGVGAHSLTATFTSANPEAFTGSASPVYRVTIAKAASKTYASSTPSTVVVKKTVVSVSVRVTAVGVTPTGRVAVAVDGKTTFYTLSASHASVKLPTFTKTGSHKVTVTYIGSSTLVKSTKSFSVSVRSR